MSVRLDEWMELETYDSRRGSFPDMPVSHWAADYIQEPPGTAGSWVIRTACSTAETVLPARGCSHCQPDAGPHGGRELYPAQRGRANHFPRPPEPPLLAYYDLMEATNGHTIVTGAEDETWHEVR